MIKTLEWTDQGVVMIDQRKLPGEEVYPVFRTYEEVAGAIEDMVVRGAPAIGVAAAMGIALGAKNSSAETAAELDRDFEAICERMSHTRPTAVNLFWAIDRIKSIYLRARSERMDTDAIKARLIQEALS